MCIENRIFWHFLFLLIWLHCIKNKRDSELVLLLNIRSKHECWVCILKNNEKCLVCILKCAYILAVGYVVHFSCSVLWHVCRYFVPNLFIVSKQIMMMKQKRKIRDFFNLFIMLYCEVWSKLWNFYLLFYL